MIIMFILLILAAFTCLLLRSGKKRAQPSMTDDPVRQSLWQPGPDADPDQAMLPDNKGYYRIVHKTGRIPRKTHLFGFLRGKYWGEIVTDKEEQHDDASFYDFHIYEAEVELEVSDTCSCITPYKSGCSGLHKEAEGKFEGQDASVFPRAKMPGQLPVIIKKEGKEYAVTIYEPQLAHVQLTSRMHQTEGKEVQGTIEAYITGILLDFTMAEYSERIQFKDLSAGNVIPLPAMPPFPIIKTRRVRPKLSR